ncbi:histidine phosphatase family protein [Lampropedia puyangensis]|nr:histidine phosphatase family protein [Lampropedia puyangensis]
MRHPKVLLQEATCYGASEVPIDTAHLHQCAQALAEQLPTQCLVITSQRQRTQAVAQTLQRLRPDLPAWQVDARLNEMDFGQWEMTPWRLIPEDAVEAWSDDFAHHRFGGQECVADVLARVHAAWAEYDKQQQHTPQPILWITHAGVINTLQYLRNAPMGTWPNARQWPSNSIAFGGIISINALAPKNPDVNHHF